MVTQKIYKLVCASMMAGALCLGAASCADDHFDVDTSGAEGGNATQTLWEQINSRSDLSNFAQLLRATPCFKDESHTLKKADGTTFTLMDALNGSGQIYTVFAPTNTAFTNDDLTTALTDLADPAKTYYAFLKYAGNHIVNFRYAKTGSGEEEIETFCMEHSIDEQAFCTIDPVTLKTIVRANPGVFVVQNGTIIDKYNLKNN